MPHTHNPYQTSKSAFDADVHKQQPVAKSGDKTLAERFRTKLCRNFVATGVCPYDTRCMFAHGEALLRTKEDNLRDGLTSEEAIKYFKREEMLAAETLQRSISRSQVAQFTPRTSKYATPYPQGCSCGCHDSYGVPHRAAYLPPPPSPSCFDLPYMPMMDGNNQWTGTAMYYDADDDVNSEPSTEVNSVIADDARSPSKLNEIF